MSSTTHDFLLGLIPTDELMPHQIAKFSARDTWPTYMLLRKPKDVNELKKYKPGVAIWRDNGTLAYVSSNGRGPALDQTKKNLRLGLGFQVVCTIVGETDEAIAETAELFWNFGYLGDKRRKVSIESSNSQFNFNLFPLERFAGLLGIESKSRMHLNGWTLSATQSVALATRPYPVELVLLESMSFEDGGIAFVDALQSRQSSFGTLHLNGSGDDREHQVSLDDTVLQRLFQTNTIEKLEVKGYMNNNLIPFLFSASISNVRWYKCKLRPYKQDIKMESGTLTLNFQYFLDFPVATIFDSLFHFDHLDITSLSLSINKTLSPVPDLVFQNLFRFIAANQNLRVLEWTIGLKSVGHINSLFSVVEQHQTLRTFMLGRYNPKLDVDYSMLIRMLSRNRRIELQVAQCRWVHRFMRSTGSEIVFLFFYRGSESLGQESQSIRPSLLGSSLMQSASNNFQRSALLLAGHTDALCQFLQSDEVHDKVD